MDQIKIDKLLGYRRKIDQGRAQKSEYTGRIKQLKQTLKTDFDCDSIEDAKEKLRKMKIKRDKLQVEFDSAFKELEREFHDRTSDSR